MKKYEKLLKMFYSDLPNQIVEIPIEMPDTDIKEIVKMNTSDLYGLETLEANGLLKTFENMWKTHKKDFILSAVLGDYRFIWLICTSKRNSGIITFYLNRELSEIAEMFTKDLSDRINYNSVSYLDSIIGEA